MKEKLTKNMGYLIVLLDIGIYFILSYVFVRDFQKNILAMIVNSSLLFIGAIIATTTLMKQGILRGRDNEKYKETLTAHINQKNIIYPKIKHLQPWLDQDYYKLMEIGRTIYVNSAGFNYKDLFSPNGKIKTGIKVDKPKSVLYTKWYQKATAWIRHLFGWIFSEDWKIYRQKKAFIRKAKRYKITRQTVSYLLNIDEDKDPNNFGITEGQYTKKQSGLAIISRLIFSVLLQSISFGFYGFNIETFLIQMVNIVLIIMSALFSMYNAYFFMVKTHRETIIKKINKLEEFDHTSVIEIEQKRIEIEEECRKENEEKESDADVKIHSKESLPTQGTMVEEIPRECEFGQENNLCSNTISRI